MSRTTVSRTYPRTPYAAFSKTGDPLNLDEVLDGIRADAELVAEYALRELTEQNLALVTYFDRFKPAEAGRRMGLFLPAEVKRQFRSGASRLEMLFRERVVSTLRSWAARVNAANGTHDGYVSAGWRRTVRGSKPKDLQPRLSLSATNNQYRRIHVQEDKIALDLVVQGQWVTLHFPTPPQLLEKGCEPGVPDIWVDKGNRAMFGFHGKTNPGRPEFSERYVVGVDVGVTNPAAYVIWDTEKKQVVERSLLGQRLRSLSNKIKRTQTQVSSLQKRNRSEEAVSHRSHLSNRRKELSILVAQEIADAAWRYDNAIVSFEDLSHIKNTMKFGRWFRGEVLRRTRDMVEADGGRVLRVNAAYTSRKCHVCGENLDMSDYSQPRCKTCGVTHHRDLNAAANIAQRANVKKACQTRRRHATKTKRVRRSKCHVRPLKYPGTKNRPTPKAPQNQQETHAHPSLPKREVSVRMCPAESRVSTVDHDMWFQTTSGTTVPKENLSTNAVGWVHPKE